MQAVLLVAGETMTHSDCGEMDRGTEVEAERADANLHPRARADLLRTSSLCRWSTRPPTSVPVGRSRSVGRLRRLEVR